ncbi:hypothetical protein DENSPDRAFT_885181 [Dentipellis sp. KUC8613]|nr:hypothetical protein DENSPDRAFT_885181 [Dentipellis sp. KUC8613]
MPLPPALGHHHAPFATPFRAVAPCRAAVMRLRAPPSPALSRPRGVVPPLAASFAFTTTPHTLAPPPPRATATRPGPNGACDAGPRPHDATRRPSDATPRPSNALEALWRPSEDASCFCDASRARACASRPLSLPHCPRVPPPPSRTRTSPFHSRTTPGHGSIVAPRARRALSGAPTTLARSRRSRASGRRPSAAVPRPCVAVSHVRMPATLPPAHPLPSRATAALAAVSPPCAAATRTHVAVTRALAALFRDSPPPSLLPRALVAPSYMPIRPSRTETVPYRQHLAPRRCHFTAPSDINDAAACPSDIVSQGLGAVASPMAPSLPLAALFRPPPRRLRLVAPISGPRGPFCAPRRLLPPLVAVFRPPPPSTPPLRAVCASPRRFRALWGRFAPLAAVFRPLPPFATFAALSAPHATVFRPTAPSARPAAPSVTHRRCLRASSRPLNAPCCRPPPCRAVFTPRHAVFAHYGAVSRPFPSSSCCAAHSQGHAAPSLRLVGLSHALPSLFLYDLLMLTICLLVFLICRIL